MESNTIFLTRTSFSGQFFNCPDFLSFKPDFFFKLALGGGASNMSRDTHCATCHELAFLKIYLAFFSNTTCFYFNLEIIFNRFGNVEGMRQVPI